MATRRKRATQQPAEPVRSAHTSDLDSAISEIRQACEAQRPSGRGSPFFLIVGAGISFPPVPLAGSIIEHCKEVAARYNRMDDPGGASTMDAYSHWFSRAYPQPRLRQGYLRSLIENQPLSVASLRLAHLLTARKLTNLVVTTNFDDFVQRGLRLFGEEPAVCDHPHTIARIDVESSDLQIAHMHGSYLFYDCANLAGEVTGRAKADADSSLTIVGLLDSILWNRSPLVIGYSGWEGDVVMSALRRRLRGGGLAQNIYWFCYRAKEIAHLPEWLVASPDVRFVVPEARRPDAAAVRRGSEPEQSALDDALEGATLPAREVFDKLNQGFDVGQPPLFDNPLEYFAAQLERSLPGEDTAWSTTNPYAFKALIQRIRAAASAIPAVQDARTVAAPLETLREAMRLSDYPRAIQVLADLVPARLEELNPDERTEVLNSAELASISLQGEKAVPLADQIAQIISIDARQEARLGPLPEGLVVTIGGRVNQLAHERQVDGTYYGAFTHSLARALIDPAADTDGDGKISVREAVIAAGAEMIRGGDAQNPVVVGNGHALSLFATEGAPAERAAGRVVALLVGVSEYRIPSMSLRGPTNDTELVRKLLEEHTERLLWAGASIESCSDSKATVKGVRAALDKLDKRVTKEDLVLFQFSGHSTQLHTLSGEADTRPTLVMHDHEGGESAFVPVRDVIEALGRLKSKQALIILD